MTNSYGRSNKQVLQRLVELGQFTSVRFTERLDEIGATPSIGSVADSYDNALAEIINGLYKNEVIHRQGPRRDVDAVELATLNWAHWFNTERLHSSLGDIPPAEFEEHHYRQLATTSALVGNQQPQPPSNPGRFIPRRAPGLGVPR